MLNDLKQKSTLGSTSFRAPHLEGIPGAFGYCPTGLNTAGILPRRISPPGTVPTVCLWPRAGQLGLSTSWDQVLS